MKKTLKFILSLGTAVVALTSLANAQVLVSFYSSTGDPSVNYQYPQSPATFADFGMPNAPVVPVEGFDVGVTGTRVLDAGEANSLTSMGGDLTLTATYETDSYRTGFPSGSGVYQQALQPDASTPLELQLSGLSSKLSPDTTYALKLFASSIDFNNSPQSASVSYTFGSASGTQDFSGTNVTFANYTPGIVDFKFTTPSSNIPDTLDVTVTELGRSSGSPALSGLAIATPEPSSLALGLIVLGLLAFEVRRRSSVGIKA